MFFIQSCVGAIVIEFVDERTYAITIRKIPLPNSEICYEHVTLEPDHAPLASEIFKWYRSVVAYCTPENANDTVLEMIGVYRTCKDELSIPLREYILSDGIVEAAYRLQLKDSSVVCQILNLLYESWSSFGSLHFSAILRPSHYRNLQTRGNERTNATDFLTFFLEHARRLKLEYSGVRMVDVSVYNSIMKSPAFVAADIWCWQPLLRYLQFGARFEQVMVDPAVTRNGVQSALTDTFRNLIRHIWVRVVQPAEILELTGDDEIKEYCNNFAPELRDLFKTLRIILRAVRAIRRDILDFVIHDHLDQWVMEVRSQRILEYPVVELMLPTLGRRYGYPVELQHACRWVIRRRLNENWQLPTGIGYLPIPKKLKSYLNLLSG